MQPNVIRYSYEFLGFRVTFRVELGSGVRVGLGSGVMVGFRVRIRVRVGFRVVLGLNLVQGCPVPSHYHNYKSICYTRSVSGVPDRMNE